MKKEKNITRIGVDVDDVTLAQVDELKRRERWPRRVVALVALEYYLRLRGVRPADKPVNGVSDVKPE